eukprot:8477889-Pyramimonas_sp.AAC.1
MPRMKLLQKPGSRLRETLDDFPNLPRVSSGKAGPIGDPGDRWGGGGSPELRIRLQLMLHSRLRVSTGAFRVVHNRRRNSTPTL